jgi:hypothetical protein
MERRRFLKLSMVMGGTIVLGGVWAGPLSWEACAASDGH